MRHHRHHHHRPPVDTGLPGGRHHHDPHAPDAHDGEGRGPRGRGRGRGAGFRVPWARDREDGPEGSPWGPPFPGFPPGPEGPGGPDPEGLHPEGHGPRGPHGPHGRRGGPRGRRPRGDVRTAVLLLLSEESMHGYQLMQTIGDRTGGRWAPSPGAVYPTLAQLEDEGLVETSRDGGRKLAGLTAEGRAHVEEHRSSWNDPFGSGHAEGTDLPDLRSSMHALGGAVREAGRGGSAAQQSAVDAILTDARRAVYRVLAEDTAEGTGGDTPSAADAGPDTDRA